MKILHICLCGTFTDGYSYQENLLAKYHQKLGYDIDVITSYLIYDDSGRRVIYEGEPQYKNAFGFTVTRLRWRFPQKVYRTLRRYSHLSRYLEESAPDVIFIHGCQFLDADVVAAYLKKHPNVRAYVDNHADFHTSAKNFLSKNILHKIIWRRCAHKLEPYMKKFYGVTPARVDFITDVYRIPREKCALLVMGADDDAVNAALRPEVRINKRKEYGVTDDDFVIVTGGKIDSRKPQVMTLMKAVNASENSRIKLIVFGNVSPEFQEEFDRLLSDRIKYVGWRRSEDIYSDFAAADLVAFPGFHSVMWEEAVGMGKPCLFRRIKGFEHIDLGGNCLFFDENSVEAYLSVIRRAEENIDAMKTAAEEKGISAFSYEEIAKKAIL